MNSIQTAVSPAQPTTDKHEEDVKSIGNYTGLESLNLKDILKDHEQNGESKIEFNYKKCTCNCECDLCTSVRTYQETKTMGIDYILNNNNCLNYLTYLNNLNSLNHVHDLKEHNLELDNYDDLIRCLPDSKLIIAIITFNMNGKHSTNLEELLLPDTLQYFPDCYVIGTQEFVRDNNEVREWTIELQTTIGPTHVLLHEASYGVLHLSLFIRRDLIWHVSVPEDDSLLCKLNPPSNLIRTKGAVAISLKIFGTTFLFVNNHLPAHQSKLQERIDEYHRMCTGLDLPRNLKHTLKRSYQSHDVTNRFDCVFWFGDLKVDQDQETVLEEIELAKIEKNENGKLCFDSIFEHDQLTLSREKGEILIGFDEHEINFQPTYKYLINSNEYDSYEKRIPSYTDRILFKNKRRDHISCKIYTAIQSIKTSDHKPVFGLFQCNIRPGGVNDNETPQNAGFFHHDIYVEGLKRLNSRRISIKQNLPEMPQHKGLIANLRARKWFHSLN